MAREAKASGLDFIYEDSQYDGKKALSAFQKLVDVDKVDLIFNWGTEPGRALAPVAEQRRIPLLTLSHDPSIAQGRRYVIRFINRGSEFSRVTAEWLRSSGYRRIGVVKSELTYLNNAVAGLTQHRAPEQSLEVVDSFSLDESDFKTSISKLKAKNFDAVGVYLLTGQISKFYRQALQLRLATPTFGTDSFDSRSEVKESGPAINGSVFSNIGVNERFQESYSRRFGNDFQVAYAGNGYDLCQLLTKLFGESKPRSAEEALDRIVQAAPQEGQSGAFRFVTDATKDQHFEFPIVLRIVIDGRIVTLGTASNMGARLELGGHYSSK
jgi:branched-chain amino acid transport system substrate-binding protein